MKTLPKTILSLCGLSTSSHYNTSLEPAQWDRRIIYYTSIAGKNVIDYVEFYKDDVLLFRHRYLYNLAGNETELIIE